MQKYVGHWWIPSVPDKKLVGTLRVPKGDGPTLEILCENPRRAKESWSALLQPYTQRTQSDENVIVHGHTQCGRFFTLYDGFVLSRSFGSGSLSPATIYFNRGLEGVCVDEPATLSVCRICMRYPGLDAWLNAGPFEVQYDYQAKHVSIKHTLKEKEAFKIDDKRKLTIVWSRKGPTQSIPQTRIGITSLPWLQIEYESPVTSSKAFDDAAVVAELLSMLLGQPTAARRISLKSPQYTSELDGKRYHTELKTLGAYFKLPKTFRKWTFHDCLFSLSSVRSDFESLLQRWFQLRHDCWGVIVPYLASRRTPAPLAESRFFSLASVAESLHTHFRAEEKNFPDTEARELCKNIRKAIPKNRRKSFCAALQRVNQLTYKQRLEKLLQRFPTLTNDVIGNSTEQSSFCNLVKDLRNIEAHRLRKSDKTNVSGLMLVRVADKLRVIIDAWLFAESGMKDSVIEAAMRNNRKYWFYASHQSWPWNIKVDE